MCLISLITRVLCLKVSYKDEVQLYRKKRAEAKETCAALRSKYGDRCVNITGIVILPLRLVAY